MFNKITIMGRLTADPELRYTQNNTPVASFTVAVDRDFEVNGERPTDFIACVAWRQGAEFVSKYFAKGSMIIADGRLESRKWQDRDGNNRTSWEINCEHTWFGERKRQEPQGDLAGPEVNRYPALRPVEVTGPEEDPFPPKQTTGSQQRMDSQWADYGAMTDDDGELPF